MDKVDALNVKDFTDAEKSGELKRICIPDPTDTTSD